VKLEALLEARAEVAARTADVPLGFAVAKPVDLNDFDFLFPRLQKDPDNLLPESRATRDALVALGRSMRDTAVGDDPAGDSDIPAAYTYLGQFIDHDITLEAASATLGQLLDPALEPLPLKEIRKNLKNARTATLDLDSVYASPAPVDGDRMVVGTVTPLPQETKPFLRPAGKDDFNDLPREPRSADIAHDRASLTGDPRNDENTLIGQLHTAFLRAHNALVDQGNDLDDARRLLRQHYQWMVLHDFLPRIADPRVVESVLRDGNRFFQTKRNKFFIPLEFVVAAYRFGHTMIRQSYDFNLNFNRSGEPGTTPATLQLLFTFTALSGQLGNGANQTDTLPENWIVEWERMVDLGGGFERARRIDTKLVEPLFTLRREDGSPEPGDGGRLAVRNLLRGYLLRIPTGQAVARAVDQTPLTPAQLEAAVPPEQAQALRDGGLLERTPLWFYLLAEAAHHSNGKHLGPVGSLIVAEVFAELVRRSEDSILAAPWQPTLGAHPGQFTLPDLLRLAGVLPSGVAIPFSQIGVPAGKR
jgi:hypothetical protein